MSNDKTMPVPVAVWGAGKYVLHYLIDEGAHRNAGNGGGHGMGNRAMRAEQVGTHDGSLIAMCGRSHNRIASMEEVRDPEYVVCYDCLSCAGIPAEQRRPILK